MSRVLAVLLTIVLASTAALAIQNGNASTTSNSNAKSQNSNKKRGPVFRATKEQIMQAQALLKQRNHYTGEQTGKLDDATRAGLKSYQKAEGLKVTGTLNKVTLEKMNIPLTEKQKLM
jgi:peptidoglycan hydrolase-like protein with peptidoglycan-binding domain